MGLLWTCWQVISAMYNIWSLVLPCNQAPVLMSLYLLLSFVCTQINVKVQNIYNITTRKTGQEGIRVSFYIPESLAPGKKRVFPPRISWGNLSASFLWRWSWSGLSHLELDSQEISRRVSLPRLPAGCTKCSGSCGSWEMGQSRALDRGKQGGQEQEGVAVWLRQEVKVKAHLISPHLCFLATQACDTLGLHTATPAYCQAVCSVSHGSSLSCHLRKVHSRTAVWLTGKF